MEAIECVPASKPLKVPSELYDELYSICRVYRSTKNLIRAQEQLKEVRERVLIVHQQALEELDYLRLPA